MKAHLMYRDRDFDVEAVTPYDETTSATADLELDTLWQAMAAGDALVLDTVRAALLSGLRNDAHVVLHRQEVLKDCLRNAGTIRELYGAAGETLEAAKRYRPGRFSTSYPSGVLYDARESMQLFVPFLKRLRRLADANASGFHSEGFTELFATLRTELSAPYLAGVQDHLARTTFLAGVLLSAKLGDGGQGTDYVLRKPSNRGIRWWERLVRRDPTSHTFYIAERDESGARALDDLRNRGINLVANALAQAADHIRSFIDALRSELAFYVGGLNLHDRLAAAGAGVCFPAVSAPGEGRHGFVRLYDVCLTLSTRKRAVDSSLDMDGKALVVVTGANQGGKSTFVRSIGVAQLMMQCGLFVGADAFRASLCVGLFTHYKREEDARMNRGKFDDELARMSHIVEFLAPQAMLLLNESFASTNEREGAEIADQIVRALLEHRIRVIFVTHMYELARRFVERKSEDVLFLRAERSPDGTRTFKIVEGTPLETSFGEDLYDQVFGSAEMASSDAAPH